MPAPRCTLWEHGLSRRQWLSGIAGLSASAMASAIPRPARSQPAPPTKDRQVLFLWIDGGMSQFESWDPKPNSQFGGPFRSIATALPGVQFSELLERSSAIADRLAIVRSMSTQDNTHSAGVPRIQRGDPKNRGVVYPFFGSAVSFLLGPGASQLPAYVHIKPGNGGFQYQDAGFLGPQYGALAFGDGKPPENLIRPDSLTPEADDLRQRLRAAANARYARNRRPAVNTAHSAVYDMAQALLRRHDLFDTTRLDPREVERYGTHEFGRHVLQARRMLEAGVRFVKVTSYGWDTHGDNFNGHLSLMPRFDQAFAAVVADLHDRGMLDQTLVIAMSEFGRTPRINGHLGRDHWPESWSLVMAGCGIRPGTVYGATNELGTSVESDPVDIGHMFHTWFRALDLHPALHEYDNHGQPLPIAHDGCSAIDALLA